MRLLTEDMLRLGRWGYSKREPDLSGVADQWGHLLWDAAYGQYLHRVRTGVF